MKTKFLKIGSIVTVLAFAAWTMVAPDTYAQQAPTGKKDSTWHKEMKKDTSANRQKKNSPGPTGSTGVTGKTGPTGMPGPDKK